MLSQNHTANQINYWLTDWKGKHAKVDEVIIDASEALWNACVKTFAELHDTKCYITACIESLINGAKLPTSFIRNDRSHFVNALTKNKLFKRTHRAVRNLLLGVIGYAIQSENIDDCEVILRHIFTLTKNKYATADVLSSRDFLRTLVATHVFRIEESLSPEGSPSQIDILHDDNDENGNDPCNEFENTAMRNWIMDIYNSVKSFDETSEELAENIYHCQWAENFVIKVFLRLPLWSNVMCSAFSSNNFTPTSSASESEFKNTKQLMGIRTRRVNVFVNSHLEQLSGRLNLALSNQLSADVDVGSQQIRKNVRKSRLSSLSEITETPEKFSPNRSHSENDICGAVQKEKSENWKGRNISPTLLKRSKNSILNPHNVDYYCHDIPFLRNGYTTKARKVSEKSIIVSNTCGMDSVFSIYCATHLDNNVTQNEINTSSPENEFSSFIKSFFVSKIKAKYHYEERTKLLMQIFTKERYSRQIKEDEHTITVQCTTGIAGLFEKLVQRDNGRIASVETSKHCSTCEYTDVNFSALIPMKISVTKQMKPMDIERYITVNHGTVFTCKKCGNHSIASQEFKNVIAFDVEPNLGSDKYRISQLKENICVRGEVYALFGVIEKILVQENPPVHHFIAHVKRQNGVWQTVDDLKNDIIISRQVASSSMSIFLLFYIKKMK